MQNIRNMIHLLEMQNEDTKFFYLTKLSLCLKTNLSMGKKNLFLLKFIFLTPFFFFTNSLHVGTFPRKRHLYNFINLSKNLKMFALF